MKRLDTKPKVTGALVYGADIKLPGMLNAAIKQCPVFGGTLVSFDESKIVSMPGVKKVVRVDENAVAVVADKWWQAKTALDALPVTWNEGKNKDVSSASINKFGANDGAWNEPTTALTLYGSYTNNSIPFRGAIDEVSIYKRPFSAEEVQALYRGGTTDLHLRLDEPPGAGLTSEGFANAVDHEKKTKGACASATTCPTSGVVGRVNQAVQLDEDDQIQVNVQVSQSEFTAPAAGGRWAPCVGWHEIHPGLGLPRRAAAACTPLS